MTVRATVVVVAIKGTPGKPIEARVQARVAELYGLGLSQQETAGACGISHSTVERILKKPEYHKIAEDVRRRRTSVSAQAAAVVSELLAAVDDRGQPAMGLRKMGAELVMKNPTLLESVEDVADDDSMLPGVVLRFPWVGDSEPKVENPRDRANAASAEQGSAVRHESDNGLTLEPHEHCGDLLPHAQHEYLRGSRRFECSGAEEVEPDLCPACDDDVCTRAEGCRIVAALAPPPPPGERLRRLHAVDTPAPPPAEEEPLPEPEPDEPLPLPVPEPEPEPPNEPEPPAAPQRAPLPPAVERAAAEPAPLFSTEDFE